MSASDSFSRRRFAQSELHRKSSLRARPLLLISAFSCANDIPQYQRVEPDIPEFAVHSVAYHTSGFHRDRFVETDVRAVNDELSRESRDRSAGGNFYLRNFHRGYARKNQHAEKKINRAVSVLLFRAELEKKVVSTFLSNI